MLLLFSGTLLMCQSYYILLYTPASSCVGLLFYLTTTIYHFLLACLF